jgi:hypothetical protein
MKLDIHGRFLQILVPGQKALEGNETADQLARLGSECSFRRPEPACGISAELPK